MDLIRDGLALLIALVLIVYTYLSWSYGYWKKRNFPYIEPKIPFGSFESPFRRTMSIGVRMKQVYQEIKNKSLKHAGIFILTSPAYVPVDLDYVKNIMAKDFQHFVDRGVYVNEKDDPIGAHLFAIGGVKWRNLRTKLTPTFTSGKMKSMFQTVTTCGDILETYMMKKVGDKQPIDIKEILACFTTDVIGSCAFGLDCNSFTEPDSLFRKYGKKIFEQTPVRSLQVMVGINFPKLGRALHIRQIPKDVSDFFTNIVEETVAYREKNNVNRKDFLQLLIELKNTNTADHVVGDGKSLTMNEVAAQSFVFFLAGFETSSTTMTFALFELARNPILQEKVRAEVKEVLARHNNEITYDSVNEMKYMGQVIDETLRMYPPVPFVTRLCVKDYKIPDEDLTIAKGTRVIIPILGIHYDEEYYPNPTEFDPDRFSDENKQSRHQYAHIPFGEGPRLCIGMRFGIMQTKVGLAALLRHFTFTVNKKTQVPLVMDKMSFISSTLGGIWLDFNKIEN